VLSIAGLATGYDGVEVIHDVDLAVGAGETICVLGPNGAGKSTMLRAIMRQIPVWRGSVRFLGQEISTRKAYEPAHLGIAYVPEGRGTLASLTVLENLEIGGVPVRDRQRLATNLAHVLALFPALEPRLQHAAGNLSGGQAQMLAIGRALMGSPKLIVLDEPSLGLAPQIVSQVYATLRALKGEGQSILLVEQAVARALELADYAYVLDRGRVATSGTPGAVRDSGALQGSYLGV